MRDELRMDEAFAMTDLRDALASGAPRRARWRAVAAALTSVVALLTVVVWTYRLQARDPSDVPVIRAAEGPAKIRPEDPGGQRFDHQGRAVYGAIAGDPPAEGDVALAPPPVALRAEDAPSPELRAAAASAEQAAAGSGSAAEAARPEALPAAPEPIEVTEIPVEPAEAIHPFVAPMVDPTANAPARAAPGPARAAYLASGGAVPSTPAAAPAAAAAASPPAEAAAGGARLQLGAYLTPDDARRMWETILGRNPDLLAGRRLALETLDRNGQTLHLLRVAPFSDAAEARALCSALKARGEDCLVAGG